MEEFKNIAVDPLLAYRKVLDKLSDTNKLPLDPTNPLTMLLEASTKNMTDSNTAHFLYERRHFPSLAVNKGELFHHISDMDAVDLFATPSKGKFRFQVNLNNIIDYAVKVSDEEYKFKIPKYSYIDVDGVRFTLMADIVGMIIIKNDNIYPYIEHTSNESTLLLKNIGNVPSYIVKDADNIDWLMFEITLSQVTTKYVISEIVPSQLYDIDISYKDQYYTSIVEIEDKVNGGVNELSKIYVDSVINPDTPSIYTNIKDKSIHYSIPQFYIDHGDLAGKIGYYIFTTKGKMLLNLTNYHPDEFEFTMNVHNPDEYSIATTKIDISVNSKDIVIGGTNTPNFREMKKKVLNRTTGSLDLPITERQLLEKGKQSGYKLRKASDLLLERVYIANKEVTSALTSLYKPYIYSSTVEYLIDADTDVQDSITFTNDYVSIKPYTLFKRLGDRFKPLTKNEVNTLDNMKSMAAIAYLNNNFITYTPYHYIMENKLNNIYGRVYQTEEPILDKIEIVNKNKELDINVNINGYRIFKVKGKNNYHIFFRLLGNESYDSIKNKVKIRCSLENKTGDMIYFNADKDMALTATYFPDAGEPLYHVEIELSDFIDDKNYVKVLNGTTTSLIHDIKIDTIMKILIYTDDLTIINTASSEAKSYLTTVERDGVALLGMTRERIQFNPIQDLHYLWVRMMSYYTERRYKHHSVDIPLTYREDIYAKDPKTGCGVLTYDDDGDGKCDRWERVKIHTKGENVLDPNGDIILKHKKGDLLLDMNGDPIIDPVLGIKRFLEMVLLNYSPLYLNNDSYINADKELTSIVTKIIRDDMSELNSKTLDNTDILFKPTRDINDIMLTDNTTHSPMVKPRIVLYIDKDMNIALPNEDDLKANIGSILLKFLSKKFIVLEDIEKAIKKVYKDVALIEINNITNDNRRFINIVNDNRFTLQHIINRDHRIEFDMVIEIKKI